MSAIVDVPLSTAIADLDEGLRGLLRSDLRRHGFDGVEISFDAPSREWSGKLSGPAVNLFLYDIREARDRATTSPEVRAGALVSPPLRLALTYAVTAWTKAVEDEHRLLSQVLAILFSNARLPDDLLGERASGVRGPLEASVGRPREDKADFWSAVGGQYKASIDYVVQIAIESGARFERGPEVRTHTIRMRRSDGRRTDIEELHGVGGTVRDERGEPIAHAWIAMPDLGAWAASDLAGRFRFARVVPGTHRVIVRTIAGHEAEATVTVPGAGADVVVPNARTRRRSAA
ncbi:MAG TPA: Pvc16 family protein [Solirubrobacteraceae bacterium]|nr:Pvc16 family protein [Solirubrobacteraceae bacterium]